MLTAKQVLKRLINHVSEDNLVNNWFNLYEDSNGEPCYNPNTACKFCIIGHINYYSKEMSVKQQIKLNALVNTSHIKFLYPHTVKQVQRIYRAWLKKLEA